MADGLVQVAPDSTGKKVDSSELTVGANTVERQRIGIAGHTVAAALADVVNTILAGTEYGLITRSLVGPMAAPAATTGAITTAATVVGPVTMGLYDGVTVTVSGTYAGVNFGFFGSNDGTLWLPVQAVRTDSGIVETTTGVLTANTSRAWDISIGEFLQFRVGSSAFTSGSAAVGIQRGMFASESAVAATTQGPAASGTTVAGNPNLIGGSDGTSVRNALVDTSGRFAVVGGVANGAAVAGNPFLCAGTFTTALPTITTGNVSQLQVTSKAELIVSPYLGGVPIYSSPAALADAFANPTVGHHATDTMLFNGTTWDRARGMSTALTTGDTGAKTATGNGATQTNVGNKGVTVVVNMGAVTGTTPTCTIKLQGSLDAGTTWYDIPGATTAALVATGVWSITVYPGAPTVAGTTVSIAGSASCGQPLPRTWRAVWTIGGTTPSFTITNIQAMYHQN